jgi:maltose alpha-D-glucosyltransferase/alpha-amylase
MQGFVLNQGDGWNWTLDYLGRTLDELLVTGESDQAEHDAFASYETFSRILGKRLGEMHALLSQLTEDEAFRPEQIESEEAAELAAEIRGQLTAAIQALGAHPDWQESDKVRAEALIAQERDLHRLIDLFSQGASGQLKIRIHGDLHLGQLLVTGSDVTIIDFEGEPTKTLAERRAKASPWRDVAGVLRSFEYASAMVEKSRRASGGPYVSADPRTILGRFERVASASFLAAYRAAAPQEMDKADGLLDLFLLQKATYEVSYEAANRPTWLDVPLRGLSDIANRLLARRDVP